MIGVFPPLPREVGRLELLDRPDVSRAELAHTLGDIARLNRLGPTRALLTHLRPFLARSHRHANPMPLRVLDVGTGGADIPVAVVQWARARGQRVEVVGLDLQPEVLACAASATHGVPEVRLVIADALRPPVRTAGVDVMICSLLLHHLPEHQVAGLLRLMADTARLGFVVSDLYRSRAAVAAAWLATRAISRNRLTRHDGPLSVRRAYTRQELAGISTAAGLEQIHWHRQPFFRVVGVYHRKDSVPGPSASVEGHPHGRTRAHD